MWKVVLLLAAIVAFVDACSCPYREYGNQTFEVQRRFCKNNVVVHVDVESVEEVKYKDRPAVQKRLYSLKVLQVLRGDATAVRRPSLKFEAPGDLHSCQYRLRVGKNQIVGGRYNKDSHTMEPNFCSSVSMSFDQQMVDLFRNTDCINPDFIDPPFPKPPVPY